MDFLFFHLNVVGEVLGGLDLFFLSPREKEFKDEMWITVGRKAQLI